MQITDNYGFVFLRTSHSFFHQSFLRRFDYFYSGSEPEYLSQC